LKVSAINDRSRPTAQILGSLKIRDRTIIAVRRQAPQRTIAERGGIDGSSITGNQLTIALALADQGIINGIDSSITAPVADFVMLAALFTCRRSGSHARRES
jgi:hypothetical protein